MAVVKNNIIANLSGKAWTAAAYLVFIPIYINFLGIEAYGLIGFYLTLQSLAGLFDMGLSTTLNRELARMSADPIRQSGMGDLVKTLEVIYWLGAFLIALIVFFSASLISTYWLSGNRLSNTTVTEAVMIMGGVIAFQLPLGFYTGGFMGLQHQVLLNIVNSVFATVRGAGAVLVLWRVSATIQAFFLWQMAVSFVHVGIMAVLLWRHLPQKRHHSRYVFQLLIDIWRFAAGMTGITITAVILTQGDKIILSRLLTLERFGYYALAAQVAGTLYYFIGPVFFALFPKFSQLVSQKEEDALTRLYHESCQFMSIILTSAAAFVCLFAQELLLIWTGNHQTMENTHSIVSLLIIGTALNGLMNLPYALQLSYGWTRLTFFSNLTAILFLIPLMIFFVGKYGAVGGGFSWIILNAGYMLICIQLMHARLLKNEKWKWYIQDIFLPMAGAIAIAGMGRFVFPQDAGTVVSLIYLFMIFMTTLAASAVLAPYMRNRISNLFLQALSKA